MVIQNLFTVEEALSYLAREAGLVWSENQFYESVSRYRVTMRAVAPKDAVTIIRELCFPPADVSDPMTEKMRLNPGHSLLAVVHPYQVAECWLRGETTTSHPDGYDELEGEYRMFLEPAKVVRADLRITRNELAKLIGKAKKLEALLGNTSKAMRTDQAKSVEQLGGFASAGEPSGKWSRGTKRVAWEVAKRLWDEHKRFTGPGLCLEMSTHPDIEIKGTALVFKKGSNGFTDVENRVESSTIKRTWATALKKELRNST